MKQDSHQYHHGQQRHQIIAVTKNGQPVQTTAAHNQIVLGPQTGLREVFSTTGVGPSKTSTKDILNSGSGVPVNKHGVASNGANNGMNIISNQMGHAQAVQQAAHSSSNLRQHNSVKPSRPQQTQQ